MSKQYYTYILANKNDTTLYIGVTNNLERRVAEHRSGLIPGFTQKYNCHKLVSDPMIRRTRSRVAV